MDLYLYDTRGKLYFFPQVNGFQCSIITGLGGSRIEISYGTDITVLQKPNGNSGSEVRKFVYTVTSNRLDKIDIYDDPPSWTHRYRTVDFTYHENVTGAVESTTGDLIGIEDQTLLSDGSSWRSQKWVYKYFTGTYNSSTNPGYPYQVKAVLGPQSVHEFEQANPTTVIYTQTASQLASYLDRSYEYASDKTGRKIDFKQGCGCGGGEGVYNYVWEFNPGTPADLNTWFSRATITLPSVNGSSRIIDYNKYGQTLNSIAQEVAGIPSSRRWIETFAHDTTGRLTDSYSVKACTSYTDSTHVVTTNTTAGQHFLYAYDANSALTTVKLRDPGNGNLNFQRKKAFSFVTSGDRRRFVKTGDTIYPTETTTDTGGLTTGFAYAYHPSDALAVKIRTTTMPIVQGSENGSGSAISLYDYFEPDGLHTWSKDGDSYVHYTMFDANARTAIKRVVDLNTASPPSTTPPIPSFPDPIFQTSSGLNLLTEWTYDSLRRPIQEVLPAFDAWDGAAIVSTKTTKQSFFAKLSTGELVTIAYPHLGSAYYDIDVNLTVQDFEGHVLTDAMGHVATAYQNTSIGDDFDPSQSNLQSWFRGTIEQRTDFTYQGSKVTQEQVWTVANDTSMPKLTTSYIFDVAGRRLTTTNPAGTITRVSYDVLDRLKSTKVGTVDGGPSDNMTLGEDRYYDDEEDLATNVGEGNLTRVNKYTSYSGGTTRTTDFTYDYRRRLTQIDEPGSQRETRTYNNRNLVDIAQRFSTSGGSTLMAKTQNFYDAWSRIYEVDIYGVSAGSASGYASVRTWRNSRGLTAKTQGQGKVLRKTQYDGAGRATVSALCYDLGAGENNYPAALDLNSDTVIEETRFAYDSTGAVELQRYYLRNHDTTATGTLTPPAGKSRPLFEAKWYDKIHRNTHMVSYGTIGGAELVSRPSGNPPSASSSSSLVRTFTYTLRSQVEDDVDPKRGAALAGSGCPRLRSCTTSMPARASPYWP